MALVNDHFLKLPNNYLFADIAKKVNAFKVSHPKAEVISLGIGDVTQPLCPAVIEAMHKAVDEMASKDTFRGYGPEQGYQFLRDAIVKNDFVARGIHLEASEIFVNDGAKSDTGNFQELVRWDNSIGVTDPIYPVYIDSNVMIGRAGELGDDGKWSNVTYMPCTAENNFTPALPDKRVDVIYLCYPNNPTGAVITKEKLAEWVNYALREKALILYDSAYEAFIQDDSLPHSIYEIEGAKECAIEFRSFSKTAGFTGIRCGYTVIPKELKGADGTPLNALWNRRQCSKFNGASYISQRGAEAIYTQEGQQQVKATIQHYMKNAQLIRESLAFLGLTVYGGEHSPYIWVSTPDGEDSWGFFHRLLTDANVVVTPGEGFGQHGEGYIRITAFGTWENSLAAMERIKKMI